nr:helix-turn-helix domain-containing protein [Lactiplantibacillus plantarum]
MTQNELAEKLYISRQSISKNVFGYFDIRFDFS